MAENESEKKSNSTSNNVSSVSSTSSPARSASDTHNFDFYIGFTKPLILNLPSQNDKRIASAWVEKLKDDSADEELRTKYLKLFLFVLHRSKLSGPFSHHPGDEELEDLPDGLKLVSVARDILQSEHYEQAKNRKENKQGPDAYPPYSMELSSDMMQYASYQEIPKFGAQIYFATSTDPIHNWDNIDTGLIPKQLIADSVKNANPTLSNLSLKSAKSKSLMEAERQASKSPKAKPAVKPFSPLSTQPDCSISDRRPITWGSNLIEVTDPPERTSKDPDDDDAGDVCGIPRPPSPPPTVCSPRQSPGSSRSPQGRGKSPSKSHDGEDGKFDDLFNTSMPDSLFDTCGMSPKSPQFRSPGKMDYDDLMNTSLPENLLSFDRSGQSPSPGKGSPRKSPKTSSPARSPKAGSPPKATSSPQKASSLPQVRHIMMSSADQEALAIIDEANKILEEQETRIEKDGPPAELPSPFLKSPKSRTPPKKQESGPSGGRSSPGDTADTPRKGQRTMAELFPDIAQGDDDDFLFNSEADFGDNNFLNESAEMYDSFEEKLREIQKAAAANTESLPVAAGVSATIPSAPMTPQRRNQYASEYPLLEEDIPDLFNLSLSPESKQRLKQAEKTSKRDAFGLIKLLTEQSSPAERFDISEAQRILPKSSPPKEREPVGLSPSKSSPKKSPTPKKSMTPKQTQSQDPEEEKQEEDNNILYEALISPCGPKPKTPTRDAYSDAQCMTTGTPSPKPFSLGWATPPQLKIAKEEPPSPSFTAHMGPPKDDEFLSGETFPDMLIETPPRGPDPMTYDEFMEACNYSSGEEGIDLLEEEEPLGAKLEAHEWHPYKKEKNFSIKVGARAKNVMLPRKSAAPRVETISEEAEYFLLKSPPQSPAQPVQIDYDAPYMLPSSARQQHNFSSPCQSPQQGSPQSSTSPKSPQSPKGDTETKSTEAQTVLDEIEEHITSNVDDPTQKELLQHVHNVIQTVDAKTQKSPPKEKSPGGNRQTSGSPQKSPQKSPGQRARSPQRPQQETCQQQTPPRPPTPDLCMISPPQGYDEIDMIDATSPIRAPGRRTPDFAAMSPEDICMSSPPQFFQEIDAMDDSPYRTPSKQRRSPRMMVTPELGMASPPPGFDEIDMIDATSPGRRPGSARKSPKPSSAPEIREIEYKETTEMEIPEPRQSSPQRQDKGGSPNRSGPCGAGAQSQPSFSPQSARQPSPCQRSPTSGMQTDFAGPSASPGRTGNFGMGSPSGGPCGSRPQSPVPNFEAQDGAPCQQRDSPRKQSPRQTSPQRQGQPCSPKQSSQFAESSGPCGLGGQGSQSPMAQSANQMSPCQMTRSPRPPTDFATAGQSPCRPPSPRKQGTSGVSPVNYGNVDLFQEILSPCRRSPSSNMQNMEDLNMASPPAGFDEVDMFDAQSPRRSPTCGGSSPRRQGTPNLVMASPPPGFGDIDMIDAQTPPRTRFATSPCSARQATPDLNMASPPAGFEDIDRLDEMSPMRPPSRGGPCGSRPPSPGPDFQVSNMPPCQSRASPMMPQQMPPAPCAAPGSPMRRSPRQMQSSPGGPSSPQFPAEQAQYNGPCGANRSMERPPPPNLMIGDSGQQSSPCRPRQSPPQMASQISSPPGQYTSPCQPRRSPVCSPVDLNMGSPPPQFADIDLIDAASPGPNICQLQDLPQRQGTPNLCMASPPPDFDNMDMFGSSPCGSPGQDYYNPQMIGTPNLDMASPPPGFDQMDMIDAEPVCGFGSPMDEYMPDFGNANFCGNQYNDIMNESMPYEYYDDSMQSPPRSSPQQTRSKRTKRSPNKKRMEQSNDSSPPPPIQEAILQQVEVQTPTRGMSGDSPSAVRRQIKKKINYGHKPSGPSDENAAQGQYDQNMSCGMGPQPVDYSDIADDFGKQFFEDQAPICQSPSALKAPVHKTLVTKIHRTPDGVTTTTTIETVEQTMGPQQDAYGAYGNQQQGGQAEMVDYGDGYYVPAVGISDYNNMGAPPPEAFGGNFCGQQAVDPYADMSPDRRQCQQLYDRVERMLEGTTYDVGDLPPSNLLPPTQYTLESPPRIDYFDIIGITNRRGIEEDDDVALYDSPTAHLYQSPGNENDLQYYSDMPGPPCFGNMQDNVEIYEDEPDLYMSPGNDDAYDACY